MGQDIGGPCARAAGLAGAQVLVTGAVLIPEAAALLEDQGVRLICVDGYAGPAAIAGAASEHQVDAILVRQGQITDSVMDASARLKVIAKHGSGVDNIDLEAASQRGIPVLRALGANAQSVAELAISLALTLMKDIPVLSQAVRSGAWPKTKYVGRDLAGAVFGIVGYGEIGRRVAALAQGFGMQVLAYDPFASGSHSLTRDLNEVLSRSDIVSLHCPLTPETSNLINAARLAQMKPGAFLINTARGAVVNEADLYDALSQGRLAGAALDSFATEPPAADHPLFSLPNVIATPHVGGASASALRNMAVQSASHILTVLSGQGYDRRALANRDILPEVGGASAGLPAQSGT